MNDIHTCRWAYCANVSPSVETLDAHLATHFANAQPMQLQGIKRRKIASGTWVRVPVSDSQEEEDHVDSQIFQPLADDLPEHASQAADTSITSETTYPIPSFPSFQLPFSFPSQPLSDHSIISAQGHNFSYSGELPGSQIDEAQLVSEMSRRYLRSLSPNPIPEDSQQSASQRSDNYGRLPEGKLRSISPFVPPTQAHPTQAQPTPSSSAPRSAQAGSSQSRAARSPSPTHASQTSSVEVGRGNTSIELQYSPPDVVSDMAPPPAVSTITAPRTPREFVFRREPANRSLGFGSAASLSSDSPKAGESPQARKGRLVSESVTGSGGVRNSRLSVGFTFGSGLGGSNGSEHRPSEP